MLDMPFGNQLRATGVVLTALCVGLCVVSLGSMILSTTMWVADLVNFLRPHLLFAATCLFIFSLLFRRAAAAVLGALTLSSALLPFFYLSPPAAAKPGTPLTVVTDNVYIDNRDPARFLSLPGVSAADVLVLQETTSQWQDALAAAGTWPFESSRKLEANNDMKLFSRFPIVSAMTISPPKHRYRRPLCHPLRVAGGPANCCRLRYTPSNTAKSDHVARAVRLPA